MNEKRDYGISLIKIIGIIVITTLLGKLFVFWGFPETNIVVIYIFAVVLVARFTQGYVFGILASIVSMLCYNYFFTQPYHTLAVDDPSYMITFSIMLIISLMISTLTTREKILTIAQLKERESMERERERANLLRAISHDLRTPLLGIMGTSEMLLDMTEEADQRKHLMKEIYKDADWLKKLVENILSLTRLQDGKVVIHKEPEAIEEVIATAVAHVERSYEGRSIQIEVPEDFRLVPMDAKLIGQVIVNLLDNAMKHTSEKELVAVLAAYEQDSLQVIVRDEGEGIPEVDVPNLFQIFYTSKTRAADVRRGIGLGLAICDTIVKAHGGTIVGRNRKDGKGAEFIFWLPLTQAEEDEGKNISNRG